MIVRGFAPAPALAPYVECLWYAERHGGAHARERALPTGTFELVFDLTEDRIHIYADDGDLEGEYFPGAVVCGAQRGYFVIDTKRPKRIVGVHFKPGGAASLLGLPASELSDLHVGLDDVWGVEARRLRQRLIDTDAPETKIEILQDALTTRLRDAPPQHPAIAHALDRLTMSPATARIAAVREETGYGMKRFIALFKHSVGLTPKLYCRVQRFQNVIARLARGERIEWAHIAADGGFYDQPHLNREFRAFAGVTPAQYRPVTDRSPNHVAIHD